MMPLIIIGFVIRTKGLNILYCCLGLIFYSLFLIIDTMMICNSNKSAGGMEISYDDYVLCALNLYLDIIMIFVYILKLLGNKD
jgi:FtsH-binding integral membrane protein